MHSKLVISVLLLLLFLQEQPVLSSNTVEKNAVNKPLRDVSLVSLLACPERYDGNLVRVSGFLHDKFEDHSLYLSKDDADYAITPNSVFVSYSKTLKTEPVGFPLSQFDGAYVVVEGRFRTIRTSQFETELSVDEVTRIRRHGRSYDGVRSTDSGRFDGVGIQSSR